MTNGLPIALGVAEAELEIIHTFDSAAANDQNGRPALDVVTLYVHNADDTNEASVVVRIGGITMFVAVPAGEIVKVFDETPFGRSDPLATGGVAGGGATIQVTLASGQDLSEAGSAWGWFVRTGG